MDYALVNYTPVVYVSIAGIIVVLGILAWFLLRVMELKGFFKGVK